MNEMSNLAERNGTPTAPNYLLDLTLITRTKRNASIAYDGGNALPSRVGSQPLSTLGY
jgi:hypothetical protein